MSMNTDPRSLPIQDQTAGAAPVPRWLLAVMVGLMAWGGYYVNRYGGRFRPDALEGTYRRIAAGPLATTDPIALGRQLFTERGCFGCHQATGLGLPDLYPPLVGSEWVLGDPERLSRVVLHGLQGPLQTHGKTFNNIMPGFAPILTDQEAAAIMTFVRQEWGNQAAPVDPGVVAAVRAAHPGRATPWTVEELEGGAAKDGSTPAPAEPSSPTPTPTPAPSPPS